MAEPKPAMAPYKANASLAPGEDDPERRQHLRRHHRSARDLDHPRARGRQRSPGTAACGRARSPRLAAVIRSAADPSGYPDTIGRRWLSCEVARAVCVFGDLTGSSNLWSRGGVR
jgi:hypothetical protein